jgi:cytochrome c-type biogenesis protein CcmE
MKPKYIVGIIAALVLITFAVVSVESKKIEYMDFARATESGKNAQIAGTWVKEKGNKYDPATNQFSFTMRDESGRELPVVLHGAKPNNFEIATSIVVTGTIENGHLRATNILTKCPSKYESDGSELNPNKQGAGGY